MVLGELLSEFLSSLASWALADLVRKPARRFVLAVGPSELVMRSKSGDEVFRLATGLRFGRNWEGTPELRAVGDPSPGRDQDDEHHIPLPRLLQQSELSDGEVEALVAQLLSVCDQKLREEVALPRDRRVRVDVDLEQDLEFANRTFALASLRRSRDAMKRQIPDFTAFHVSTG